MKVRIVPAKSSEIIKINKKLIKDCSKRKVTSSIKRPLAFKTVDLLVMFLKTEDVAAVAVKFNIKEATVLAHIKKNLVDKDRIEYLNAKDKNKESFFVLVDKKHKYFIGDRPSRKA